MVMQAALVKEARRFRMYSKRSLAIHREDTCVHLRARYLARLQSLVLSDSRRSQDGIHAQ
jgi:hypothetical protein